MTAVSTTPRQPKARPTGQTALRSPLSALRSPLSALRSPLSALQPDSQARNSPSPRKTAPNLSSHSSRIGIQRFAATVALAGALWSAVPKQAEAAVMLAPGTVLPGEEYKTYGATFADSVVAIKTISPTSGTVRYASGVQLDEYTIITAAHVLDAAVGFRPFANVFVLGGVNFFSPDFESSIATYVIHPTYSQGSGLGTGSQIDLAVITLSTPIFGRGAIIGSSIPNGEVVALAGYGQHGLSPSSLQAQDGYIRAFNGETVNPSGLFDNQYYGMTIGFSSINLRGMGAQYDSGGGVFHDNQLVGFMTAASGSSSTTFLDLTNSEIQNFIAANSIPEPSRAVLIFGGLLVIASRRRRM
jgi:hypothetical protein